jgi:hypothetical protein
MLNHHVKEESLVDNVWNNFLVNFLDVGFTHKHTSKVLEKRLEQMRIISSSC